VRVELDVGGRRTHLGHGIGFQYLEAVALDHGAKEPQHVIEDDDVGRLRLDALGELRLAARYRLTQLAALDLEVLERDQRAGMFAGLRLLLKCGTWRLGFHADEFDAVLGCRTAARGSVEVCRDRAIC
jgi:hypothetical protein